MQIDIDTNKLPVGTTKKEVLAVIHEGLSWLLDQSSDDPTPLEAALYELFPDPNRKKERFPENPAGTALRMMNGEDLAYLRRTAQGYGLNDWMSGWGAEKPLREKLKRLGLVEVKFHRAQGMGDVDSTWCTPTKLGHEVLKVARGARV